MSVDPNSANDYVHFSNQVRAAAYCDQGGANCSTAADIATVTSQPGVGVNQTWTNVTASRVIGVTYQNTTGRPIMVSIDPDGQNNTYVIQISNNGSTWMTIASKNNGDGGNEAFAFIVPSNVYYRMTGSAPIFAWTELR
jgi:hypothetical protein